ncbi:sugar O-acetyltransferase [Tropicibacter sp. R16_0]|uniref:sugar O-acetyltransferase n=1 Tax=Tropicibacter sp. R16_0 TaxID=2821102 RepID=UPI00336AC5F1
MTDTFDTRTDQIMARHTKARRLLKAYNASDAEERDARTQILSALLGTCRPGAWIEPPFFCDYGDNIHLDAGVFINFNCTMLDGDQIHIGEGTLLGPSVQIYATTHPIQAEDRIYTQDGLPKYRTSAQPVTIGKHVWVGGGAIILPGVEIGDGTTVGAGSIVTQSLPARVFAAGNPCRIVRQL